MSKNELSILLNHMGSVDHWEMLDELSQRLNRLSHEINTIHHEFEGIADARKKVPRLLVEAHILNLAVQSKLAVMNQEWNDTVDAVVEEWKKQYVNYDEIEF